MKIKGYVKKWLWQVDDEEELSYSMDYVKAYYPDCSFYYYHKDNNYLVYAQTNLKIHDAWEIDRKMFDYIILKCGYEFHCVD